MEKLLLSLPMTSLLCAGHVTWLRHHILPDPEKAKHNVPDFNVQKKLCLAVHVTGNRAGNE